MKNFIWWLALFVGSLLIVLAVLYLMGGGKYSEIIVAIVLVFDWLLVNIASLDIPGQRRRAMESRWLKWRVSHLENIDHRQKGRIGELEDRLRRATEEQNEGDRERVRLMAQLEMLQMASRSERIRVLRILGRERTAEGLEPENLSDFALVRLFNATIRHHAELSAVWERQRVDHSN